MAEMGLGVSNHVIVRDEFGRFIRDMENAAQATIREAVDRGVQLSKDFAPTGHKHDRRTVPLAAGFYTEIMSRTSGRWGNFARHALPQEKGGRPHIMIGSPTFKFYWEREHRMWEPGLFGEPDIIHHPGNPAHPFLRPAYRIVSKQLTEIAKKHYPG